MNYYMRDRKKIKMGDFLFVVDVFHGITTELTIDLAIFEDFGEFQQPDEKTFLEAISNLTWTKLKKLTLINFAFNIEIEKI